MNINLPLRPDLMERNGYPWTTTHLIRALRDVEPSDTAYKPPGPAETSFVEAVVQAYATPIGWDRETTRLMEDTEDVRARLRKHLVRAHDRSCHAGRNGFLDSLRPLSYPETLWAHLRAAWLDILCRECCGYGTDAFWYNRLEAAGPCPECCGSGVRPGYLRTKGDPGKWFVAIRKGSAIIIGRNRIVNF